MWLAHKAAMPNLLRRLEEHRCGPGVFGGMLLERYVLRERLKLV
jgi:hypothetical protein